MRPFRGRRRQRWPRFSAAGVAWDKKGSKKGTSAGSSVYTRQNFRYLEQVYSRATGNSGERGEIGVVRTSVFGAIMLALPAFFGGAAGPLDAQALGPSKVPACIVADASCKESLVVGDFSFWYFRSYSLKTPNPDIKRAVIVMHGLQRNADDYFTAVVTALRNDVDPSPLVIAPHFKGFVRGSTTCSDPTEAGELHWSCQGQGSINRWDDGGQARDTGTDTIYSFSMIDRLTDSLNDRSLFPNLANIIITGHSDGGQFTQRYAAGNRMDGEIGAFVKYVIANPGSYMYLDNLRLLKGATCLENGTCTAQFTPDWDPDIECPDSYNNYKYGLDGRSFGYMNSSQPGFSDEELRNRYTSRAVAYLMGEQDQLNNSQFDTSCAANAQGSHLAGDGFAGGRRERGTIYWNYIRLLGANHTLTIVPGCGHDPICMYYSAEMIQAILF
jgi:pimeloyl-ACP methyl ester carboxylesterase